MNNFLHNARGFFYGLRNYFPNIFWGFWRAISEAFFATASIIGPFIAPLTYILFNFLNEKFPKLWQFLLSPKIIRYFFSLYAIRKFGNVTKPRPHPFSMHADYPTWTGFVNRKFSGRHLEKQAKRPREPNRPSRTELEHLFMRPVPTGAQVDDVRSNLLFAAFAQWFTDSFLRTSHKLDYGDDDLGNTSLNDDGTRKRHPGRERENDSNHEIDLCQIYGVDERATLILRNRSRPERPVAENDKGTLKYQLINGEEFPAALLEHPPAIPEHKDDDRPRVELTFREEFSGLFEEEELLRSIFRSAIRNPNGYKTLFACGLEHGNSTIGNSLFNTIFLRHHNYVARKIAAAHTCFDEDEVFEKARNVMIVLLLKIVVSDYVRHISPLNLPFMVPPKVGSKQNWYRRNRIHIEFNLLYRWHSLVPDSFPFLQDRTQETCCDIGAEEQKKNFDSFRHNNDWLINNGLAKTLEDFISTPAGKMTMGNTPQALRMVKRDTLKLMRASNLRSYNDYRKRFGLHPAISFEEVTGEKVIAAALSDLYGGRIEDLEFYIGLVAERHRTGAMMGDLMFAMVAHDALTHAITNPLLADEMQARLPGYSVPGEHVFSSTGVKIIAGIETLDDLVRNVVTGLPEQETIGFRKRQN